MRLRNSLQNILSGLVGQIVITITGFISRSVFIHVLGSTYLGVSGLFSNVLTLLSFAELGVGQAIIYSLYKPIAVNDKDKIHTLMKLYEKVYRFLFAFVLVVGLLLLPLLPYIIKDIDSVPHIREIYALYVVNSAVTYLMAYRTSFLTATQKNYIVNSVSFVTNIAMCIAQIISLLAFKNYFVYLIIQMIFGLVPNIASYVYTNKKYSFLRNKSYTPLMPDEFKKIKDNVKALIIYKIGSLALNSTDNILISSIVGLTTVGLYSNYLLLTTTVSGFLSTIFSNLTASIGNLNAVEGKDRQLFIFKVINFCTFWFYSVCVICLFICMTPFIKIWIGDQYILGIEISLIITLNIYVGGMLFAPFNYRQTMGLFVQGKMRPIISAVINLVSSILLGRCWGLFGILFGTIIARLTTNAWFDPYLVYKKGLNTSPIPYYFDYIYKLVLLIIMGGVSCYISAFVPDHSILWLLLKACVTFVMCNLIVLLIYHKTEEFKYLLEIVKNLKGL